MNLITSSNHFDPQFTHVKNLRWFPHVGKNYSNEKPKFLLVGESHYFNPAKGRGTIDDKNFSRYLIDELAMGNRDYTDNSRFHKSVNAMFAPTDPNSFWESVAFCNFIQKPMEWEADAEVGERPMKADWILGWEVFEEVTKVLHPDYCIFLGVTASNYLGDTDITGNLSRDAEKINGVFPRSGKIGDKEIFCIQHPSTHFSKDKWKAYLKASNQDVKKLLERF